MQLYFYHLHIFYNANIKLSIPTQMNMAARYKQDIILLHNSFSYDTYYEMVFSLPKWATKRIKYILMKSIS